MQRLAIADSLNSMKSTDSNPSVRDNEGEITPPNP